MRKFTQKLFLLSILLLGCYVNSKAQNLEVSGITSPAAANGVYVPNGTLYTYDSWKHESENYYIYNDDYAGRYWNIDDNTSDIGYVLFYSSSSSTAASPVGLSFSMDVGVGNPIIIEYIATTAPTVTTTAASSISTTSATLGGEVTSDGGASVTERGIVYSTIDATPTIAEGATKDANGSGTGTFSESIGSLSLNTTYYYNSYAINTEGTSYGTASQFTTLKLSQFITFGALPTKTYGNADFVPGATASSGLTVSYSSSNTAVATIVSGKIHIVGAGTCTIYADQAGNSTYWAASQESQSLTINKATPTITWADPSDIVYGTALSATELNATSPVAGTFVYTPALTTVLDAGAGQTLSVEFTPTDDVNYNTNTATATLNVTKATPTVDTWPTASGIIYGDALSLATLSGGTASVAGSFAYDDNTIIPNIGIYSAALTFTPDDGSNYNTVSGNINVTVYNHATVTTIAATEITANTVTVNGLVNANNASTDVTFEYGLTTSYGTNVIAVQSPVTGNSDTDVSLNITGLVPNTLYHFRVIGVNAAGTNNGGDMTFTTIKYDQTLTFDSLSDKTTNDDDFDPGATSDLGLDITYVSSDENVATIVSNLIHIVGEGVADITASQEGNDTVYAASPVVQSLTVTQATGTENIDFIDFRIFPNPVNDYMSIDIGNLAGLDVKISIIDLSGKILRTEELKNNINTIDMSDYSSGLYFIQIETPKGSKKLKFIKE
jgi:Secretion system C-terminal sorting domain